jgi:erythromycin esterase-like protein
MKEFEQPRKIESGRNVEEDQLAFVEAIKNSEISEIDTEFDEKSVESLIFELGEAKLLLLGETHGVKENVDIIYTLFKKFGFKKLALEWDEKLREQADNFLQSGKLVGY